MRYSDFKLIEAPDDGSRAGQEPNRPSDNGLQAGPPYPQEDVDRVKSMQTKLEQLGYSVGNTGIDGKYGPRTTRAVAAFKKDNNISTQGIEIVPEFKNTYFEEVYNALKKKFKLGRVRILLKEPRSTLSWHRDPEPRLHVPIITNPGCKMVIEDIAKHMPADGSVTITNNTKYHNFFNGGEQDRIHLVACVLENPFKKGIIN